MTHMVPPVCLSAQVMSLSESDYCISIKIIWTGQAGSVRKLPCISLCHSWAKLNDFDQCHDSVITRWKNIFRLSDKDLALACWSNGGSVPLNSTLAISKRLSYFRGHCRACYYGNLLLFQLLF